MVNKSPYLGVFLLMFCNANLLFSQWMQSNGPGPQGSVSRFAIIDSTLFTGTKGFGIFLSSIGGADWHTTNSDLEGSSVTSFAIMGDTLFVGFEGRGVFYSTNSGTAWQKTGLPDYFVTSMKVDGSNIFVGTATSIYVSNDRGMNWSIVNHGLPGFANISCLAVIDGSLFAGGYRAIYVSSDNGTNWKPIEFSLTNEWISAFATIGTNIFAATTDKGIFLSSNNGASWKNVFPDSSSNTTTPLTVMGSNLLAGTTTGVYRTTDDGANWTMTGLAEYSISALCANGSKVYAGSDNGEVFLSTDSGLNWTEIGSHWDQIYCLETKGTNIFAGGNGFFRSTNNGVYWERLWMSHFVYSLIAANNIIFAGTSQDGLYYSADNGSSWMKSGLNVSSVYTLISTRTSILALAYEGVFRSSDNGLTWTETAPQQHFTCLAVSDSIIYAGTKRNGIFLSTNDGQKWLALNSDFADTANVFTLIAMGNHLFAMTNLGVLRYEKDGSGRTAANDGLLERDFVHSFIVNGMNLIAGANYGNVYILRSDGTSWEWLGSIVPSHSYVTGLAVCGPNVFAGTDLDGVWQRPLSQIITGIEEKQKHPPSDFALSQNYPNPFNPSTNISFSMSSRSKVSLKIYDVIGREVTALINGELSAGRHTLRWDASGFSSGIYFYRFQAGSFTETRKLILIR